MRLLKVFYNRKRRHSHFAHVLPVLLLSDEAGKGEKMEAKTSALTDV